MMCAELLVVVRKPAPTPLLVRELPVVRGFLDELFKVLSVVGCVIVVRSSDVVIPV